MATDQPTRRHPMQQIVRASDGVIRFRENAIVRALLDEATARGGLDLNKIAIGVGTGQFSVEDEIQLAQLIGYSVSGFGDLSYAPRDIVRRADRKAEEIHNGR